MKNETLAIGDVVWLKSGGLPMTVTCVGDEKGDWEVDVSWHSDAGPETSSYPSAALTKKEPTI